MGHWGNVSRRGAEGAEGRGTDWSVGELEYCSERSATASPVGRHRVAPDRTRCGPTIEDEDDTPSAPAAFVLENEAIKVQINSDTGAVHSLIDKTTDTDLADPENPLGAIEFQIENPKGSNAWEIGKLGPASAPEIKEVRNSASGPYIARVEVDWQVSESGFTTTYEVRHGDPTLYIKLDGFWTERGDKEKGAPHLKMAFPSRLTEPTPCYEVPFGALEQPSSHRGQPLK